MSHLPVARGLVVCDVVIVEERTRNLTLVNCFTLKRARAFPAHFHFTAAAFLSDGEGDIHLTVSIQRLDTLAIMRQSSHRVRFIDRMQEVRFFVRVEDCRFPVPGHYQISLLADGNIIAQQRIQVTTWEESV